MISHDSKNVVAIITAGGSRSSTIHPVNISKTFLPFLNKPAIENTLENLSGLGIAETFLAVGPSEVKLTDLPKRCNGLSIHTLVEEHPRGTAGCIKQIAGRLNGRTLIVISGSLLFFTQQDLADMIRFHRESGNDMTVGLTPAGNGNGDETEQIRFGSNGLIDAIDRIYPPVPSGSGPKTSGLYIMESHVLDHVRENGFFDLKEQLIPRIRSANGTVMGWTHAKHNFGARTIDEYLAANFKFLANHKLAKQYLQGYHEVRRNVWVGENSYVSPSAVIVRPTIIGHNVRVEDNASIVGPSIIGDRCVIGQDSIIKESVLWPESEVPHDFSVEKCLLSGRAFSFEKNLCREMILINGTPSLTGTPGAAKKPIKRQVVYRPIRTPASETVYLKTKRAIDITLSALGLISFTPLFALIAALIKLDSKGPVFFLQERNGEKGEPFRMIKFRSMVANAEDIQRDLWHLNEADGPMFKIANDPRETRLGKILRACKLDELPQLINVLRGEMSLVGPRPLSMNEMRFNPHWRDARLLVKPGVTGLWQMKDKDSHVFYEWIRYDLQYVDERSHWLDFKIIVGTCLKVFHMARRIFRNKVLKKIAKKTPEQRGRQ
jgi:lipopolysaccharide/colanic/teichoic acid biosynthesis glycosyltransferase